MAKKKTDRYIFVVQNSQMFMKKGERTKQLIIEKASDIINTKGMAATSVEDVLEAAKITRGCLLGHFPTKEDLNQACADFMLTSFRDIRNNHMEKGQTALEKIMGYFDFHKQPLRTPVEGGCPIMNLAVEADDTNPYVNRLVRKEIDHNITLFTNIFEEGKANGEFSGDLDSEEFATKMFAAIEGAYVFCRSKNSQKPMKIVIAGLKNELATYATNKTKTN